MPIRTTKIRKMIISTDWNVEKLIHSYVASKKVKWYNNSGKQFVSVFLN
jgi:hypothetical protein